MASKLFQIYPPVSTGHKVCIYLLKKHVNKSKEPERSTTPVCCKSTDIFCRIYKFPKRVKKYLGTSSYRAVKEGSVSDAHDIIFNLIHIGEHANLSIVYSLPSNKYCSDIQRSLRII